MDDDLIVDEIAKKEQYLGLWIWESQSQEGEMMENL